MKAFYTNRVYSAFNKLLSRELIASLEPFQVELLNFLISGLQALRAFAQVLFDSGALMSDSVTDDGKRNDAAPNSDHQAQKFCGGEIVTRLSPIPAAQNRNRSACNPLACHHRWFKDGPGHQSAREWSCRRTPGESFRKSEYSGRCNPFCSSAEKSRRFMWFASLMSSSFARYR